MTHEGVAPIVINFMLTCYFSPDPKSELGESHWDSPAGVEVRTWLVENELVSGNCRATSRGEAWVKFICETPLPIQQWVRP